MAIEAILDEQLVALAPGSRVLGEEATHDARGASMAIGPGLVWVVDPLDGTANYIAGDGPVATMVALVVDGVPRLGCIRLHDGLALLSGVEGVEVLGGAGLRPKGAMSGRGRLSCRFLANDVCETLHEVLERDYQVEEGSGCAGRDYVDLALGAVDFLIYERVLPWDHVPGSHAVGVLGGSVRVGDGMPYRGQSGVAGLVVSTSNALTAQLLKARSAVLR